MKRPFLAIALATFFGILFLYWPYFSESRVFYSTDNYPFFFVMQRHWFESFALSGQFPTWVPYVNMGTSFLYNPAIGVFYLPNYIQFLISPLDYYQFGWVLHLTLLIWGLTRWARALHAPTETQVLIAGLFGGAAITHVFSVTQVAYLFSMTWCVWILSELALGLKTRWSVARLLLFWLCLIGNGEVFSVFLTGVAVMAWLAYERKWKHAALFVAASLLFAIPIYGHSSVILPYTTRASGLDRDMRVSFSLNPLRLLTWFSPYFFGHIIDNTFPENSIVNNSKLNARLLFDTIYMPLPIILLIWLGTLDAWRRRSWIWLGICTFGLLTAFGKYGLMSVFSELPPFKYLRYPEKMMMVTSVLLLGLALSTKENPLDRLKKIPLSVWVICALAIVLPFFSRRNEHWVSYSAIGITLTLWLHQEKKITRSMCVIGLLTLGWVQNWAALPPQRTVQRETMGELSTLSKMLLETVPEGSFRRVEIAPNANVNDKPHPYLLFGTNLIHRRASVLGYTSIDNDLVDHLRNRIYGEAYGPESKPLGIDEAKRIIQLTNWQIFALRMDGPLPHLFDVMADGAGVFRVLRTQPPNALVAAAQTPSFAWYFPHLSRTPENISKDALFAWPPHVERDWHFLGARRVNAPAEVTECSNPKIAARALSEDSVRKISESLWHLEFETPCTGWVFLSQNLTPGWVLHDSTGAEVPLVMMNKYLVGFPVRAGRFSGEFEFRPWQALAAKFF